MKPREFWIQWYPAGHPGPKDSIMYPAVCTQPFKSVFEGEMIHVREVTPEEDFKMKKSFEDLVKEKSEEKTKQFKDALLFAESERNAGNADFIDSCKGFFNDRGYLTEKQINALFSLGGL